MLERRGFLISLSGLFLAPAIIRPGRLMPISSRLLAAEPGEALSNLLCKTTLEVSGRVHGYDHQEFHNLIASGWNFDGQLHGKAILTKVHIGPLREAEWSAGDLQMKTIASQWQRPQDSSGFSRWERVYSGYRDRPLG